MRGFSLWVINHSSKANCQYLTICAKDSAAGIAVMVEYPCGRSFRSWLNATRRLRKVSARDASNVNHRVTADTRTERRRIAGVSQGGADCAGGAAGGAV